MKSCPSCHKTYEDNSMMFCLDDGARLSEVEIGATDPNATLHLTPPRITEPGSTVASPPPTIRAQPEMAPLNPPAVAAKVRREEASRRTVLPWLLGIAIAIGVSGVLMALILTRSRSQSNQQGASTQSGDMTAQSGATPSPSVKALATTTPTKSPERSPNKGTKETTPATSTVTRTTPQPSPRAQTESRQKPTFAVLNNISFNGTRITYYPRPSFGMCQADCASNANCKGFTWIRPGAYNPGDSAMCYLMSAVTGRVPHPCCMSAIKN